MKRTLAASHAGPNIGVSHNRHPLRVATTCVAHVA